MRKYNYSFRVLRAGTFLHHYFLGKRNNKNRRRLQKGAILLAAAVSTSLTLSAQCNTFKNADKANPISAVLDAGRTVAGFAFADIDADGDQDIYVSYKDRSYPLKATVLSFYRNTGTKEHPVYTKDEETGFGQHLAGRSNRFLQFADIDSDGDLDYFASDNSNNYFDFPSIIFYKNVGTAAVPTFDSGYKSPLPAVTSHVYQPFALADMDGDGDLDFYTCDVYPEGAIAYGQKVYFNRGTPIRPKFDAPVSGGEDHNADRTYYDWNKDGLVDFFGIPSTGIGSNYNKNVGPANKPDYVITQPESPAFKHGGPYRLIDLNNDGAPEVFDFTARYSILPPVAVILDTLKKNGNKTVTVLSSKNTGATFTYRWERNGKTMAGENDSYIIAKQSGTYTLYVTNRCGTSVSLNYIFKRNGFAPEVDSRNAEPVVTRINDTGIKTYPNPFSGSFTVKLPGGKCTVKVLDMAGRELLLQTTSDVSLQTGQTLRNGMYTVQVWKGQVMIYKTTVVKQ